MKGVIGGMREIFPGEVAGIDSRIGFFALEETQDYDGDDAFRLTNFKRFGCQL